MTTFTIGSRTRTNGVVASTSQHMVDDDDEEDGKIEDAEEKPSKVTDRYWLMEQANVSGGGRSMNGKWMLFFPNSRIDSSWAKAKMLLRQGNLLGISAMKVSTARENSRASCNDSKVIIFYCGPAEDEANVLYYGQNLVAVMRYKSFNSNPFVYYKADSQTDQGTRATGQRKNNLYKIRVPPASSSFTSAGDAGAGRKDRKRKFETASDLEETRKRMARMSPSKHENASLSNSTTVSSSSEISGARSHPSSTTTSNHSAPSSVVSDSATTMTRIKFRLENVADATSSTLVASFPVTQSLGELVAYLTGQLPGSGTWKLIKTFPTEELKDLTATVQDAGLFNAVVIARRT